MTATSERMQKYFESIEKEVLYEYDKAKAAKEMGFDADDRVDIKLAKNMAERVEGLISVVAQQLVGSGVTERIIELEKEYEPMDWRVALKIALEVASEKFCKFKDKKEAMEVGIRTGFAYQTAGIVAAPLEGFTGLKIRQTYDGKEYFVPCYAGPIRGAGGTAAAFSLLLTDYIRVQMGYAKYDPSEKEINRYKGEIYDYHERVTNLQYLPSLEELDFLMRHLPVQVDGEPTETKDVSNYKDTPRVETNKIRGGICLVLAEGLSQKAPKLWKRLEEWGKDFGMDWDFLGEFLKLQKDIKAKKKPSGGEQKKEKLSPNYTFIADMVAGRPVLTFPMAKGGFRLRYGRARTSGFSAAAINPATMLVLDKFVAIGTQLKVERPGKAAAITACDMVHGPVVLLEEGSVRIIETIEEAKACKDKVKQIIYIGDILFNYGDFSENGHVLVPCGYNEDWYVQQLRREMKKQQEDLSEEMRNHIRDPKQQKTCKDMIALSKKYNVPLHPRYTYYWTQITQEQFEELVHALPEMKMLEEKVTIKNTPSIKQTIELLGIPHILVNNEFIVIEKDDAAAFLFSLGIEKYEDIEKTQKAYDKAKTVLENINFFAKIEMKDKAGTTIGARMGRPEKAKIRELTGSPHGLFPIGSEGGRLRSFQAALEAKKVTADFPVFVCSSCEKESVHGFCYACNKKAKQFFFCQLCGKIPEPICKVHGKAKQYKKIELPIEPEFSTAVKYMQLESVPSLIKGIKGTSNEDHVVEYIGKAILRAKHDVYVNKDGTIRYDMSELPLTHFKPAEVGTSVEKLLEMGYEKDIDGKLLENPEQVLELYPQDVVLPAATDALNEPADAVLFRTAQFIDDLLVRVYKQKPFYKLSKKSDLVGHLTICLAPHISAGMVGRIVGFSKTQGFFAHPLFHAALRRDCDGDEASVSLLLDGLLNFSRRYLPARIGARTMDAPLVLTSRLIPTEVDDQALGLDVMFEYPIELYEAAEEYQSAKAVKVEQIKNRVNTPLQYEGVGFTHGTTSINIGISCSAYKELPSMEDKVNGQMQLAVKIRAVSERDVARLVIEKHFLKDTKGNLRKFSQQGFRCVKCNESYRRPPLLGKCLKCSGKIIFTISEGSVIKYLALSIKLAETYDVSPYLKQTLDLLQRRVDAEFGKDKETQEALGKWFG
ncbi:DNA polymerase II large subunit [Candidatus Woesearchaeota archaeon]|nr:DNA polymerase II large subunit [Candidatus Woesearchaeota archaeon]